MRLHLFISKRYFLSKKKQSVINIISLISVIGVALGTIALIVVLSIFNGIDELVKTMQGAIDSDIKIIPAEGKSFLPDSSLTKRLRSIEGVIYYSEIIEESCLLKYEDRQRPVVVKGVDIDYGREKGIDTMLFDGEFKFKEDGIDYVVPGFGIAKDLGIGITFVNTVDFYFPKKKTTSYLNPMNALNKKYAHPAGIFSIQQEIDSKYIFTSLGFADKLFNMRGNISAIEINLVGNKKNLEGKIRDIVGQDYIVQNRFQQNETLYKMMNSEKIVIFFILVFILLVASFNIVGSLTMLIIDKKDDIVILTNMGMTNKDVQRVFWYEGWMITCVGALAGLFLGTMICWLQMEFGLITLGSGYIAEAYPVELRIGDLFLIMIAVSGIGYIASKLPVKILLKRLL